jgi:UTP:GlnB (protein PII) uridylyltransferase
VKTTVEIPDPLFRMAKALSAEKGISLKEFFTQAVTEQLRKHKKGAEAKPEPPWKKAFGGLRELHTETKRIERIIAKEFEKIDEDEWR